MKDDVISRQAAITLPVMPKEHREYQTYNLDDVYEQGWFDLQKCIEELPSEQPEQQWVTLNTNQLPEEGQQVFIQFKEGRDCPYFNVQAAYLGEHDVEDNNFRKIGVKKVWYTNQYYYDLDRVIAWMPRPKLYMEKENETD